MTKNMVQFLYKDFLEDKRIYNLHVGYWRRYLRRVLRHRGDLVFDWMNTSFGNGTHFYDGNPIITVLLKNDRKALRIIQEEPETDEVQIGAWLGDIEHEGMCYKELVISLELSKETKRIAQKIIERWIGNANLSSSKMSIFIDQVLSDLDRTASA